MFLLCTYYSGVDERCVMKSVTFTELRAHAKKFFDEVEHGETLEVYRHGKPVAILYPYHKKQLKRRTPLPLKGVSVSAMVIESRKKGH